MPVTFEEADIASLPPPPSPQEEGAVEEKEVTTPTTSASSMMHLNLNVTRIFRRKKKKRQEPGKVLYNKKNSRPFKVSITCEKPRFWFFVSGASD